MNEHDALRKMPQEGFLKVTNSKNTSLSPSQRTALIRKGNELFNAGHIEQAKRVFLTTGYGDGLARVGDHFYTHHRPLEALRMYWIAPAPDRVEKMIEKISSVVVHWLTEDKESEKNEERSDP